MGGVSSGGKKWHGRCIESFRNVKETAPTKLETSMDVLRELRFQVVKLNAEGSNCRLKPLVKNSNQNLAEVVIGVRRSA